jgi:hypothetical protein
MKDEFHLEFEYLKKIGNCFCKKTSCIYNSAFNYLNPLSVSSAAYPRKSYKTCAWSFSFPVSCNLLQKAFLIFYFCRQNISQYEKFINIYGIMFFRFHPQSIL